MSIVSACCPRCGRYGYTGCPECIDRSDRIEYHLRQLLRGIVAEAVNAEDGGDFIRSILERTRPGGDLHEFFPKEPQT